MAQRPENLIVRSSWIFGDGKNFVRTVLTAARSGRRLQVVDDQRGRPTAADDLALALVRAVERGISGIFHVSGDGPPCTWADLAEHAIAIAGMDAAVERVDTASYRNSSSRPVAPRPANSVLSIEKGRSQGIPLGDWRSSLETYVRASG